MMRGPQKPPGNVRFLANSALTASIVWRRGDDEWHPLSGLRHGLQRQMTLPYSDFHDYASFSSRDSSLANDPFLRNKVVLQFQRITEIQHLLDDILAHGDGKGQPRRAYSRQVDISL